MRNARLHDEIRKFQQSKKLLVPALILVGMLGLLLPIIPGMMLLFLAFYLVFPRQGHHIVEKLRRRFNL